jgi:hypothetical protein
MPAIISHESVHAAWKILEYAGVTVTADNHEALAYLTEYVFAAGMELLNQYEAALEEKANKKSKKKK